MTIQHATPMNESDRSPLVAELFAAPARAGALLCSGTNVDDLPCEERLAVVGAAAQRQQEFAGGRLCARSLLAKLGVERAVLACRADGAPQWPPGFVGSIAHSGGLCVAAVAPTSVARGIGIDVEVAASIEVGAWDLMCTPRELSRLRSQGNAATAGFLATMLFSAKESTYKSFQSESIGGFEPRGIEIDWDGAASAFCATIAGVDEAVAGTLIQRRGWILSGVLRRQPGQLPEWVGNGTQTSGATAVQR